MDNRTDLSKLRDHLNLFMEDKNVSAVHVAHEKNCTELENYDVYGHLSVDLDFNVSKQSTTHCALNNFIKLNEDDIDTINSVRLREKIPFLAKETKAGILNFQSGKHAFYHQKLVTVHGYLIKQQ